MVSVGSRNSSVPLSSKRVWVFATTPENWEVVKARSLWGVKREGVTRKVREGDIALIYVKRSSCFTGAYELVGRWFPSPGPTWPDEVEQQRIIYRWQIRLKIIQLGIANVRELIPKLSFIENKERWSVYLQGTPANMGRPISQEDYQLIIGELQKHPVVPPKEVQVTRAPPAAAEPPRVATHKELVEMVQRIGEMLDFTVRTEEYAPDQTYRYDVTWRDYEAHSPIKVFEIEVSGNVDHALSSLAHAYDVWRPETLYLIIVDERDRDRVGRLVEPRLRGAFSRIGRKLKVYLGADLMKLHDSLKSHENLLKELAKRRYGS